jgi:hypothetical protein
LQRGPSVPESCGKKQKRSELVLQRQVFGSFFLFAYRRKFAYLVYPASIHFAGHDPSLAVEAKRVSALYRTAFFGGIL